MRQLSSFNETFFESNANNSEKLFSNFDFRLIVFIVNISENSIKIGINRKVIHIINTKWTIYNTFHSKYNKESLLQILVVRILFP